MADMYAQIIGDKQLLANLNALAPKVKKRIMKPAMRVSLPPYWIRNNIAWVQ